MCALSNLFVVNTAVQRNLAKMLIESKLMKDLKVRLTDRVMNKFAIMKDGRMELHIGEYILDAARPSILV